MKVYTKTGDKGKTSLYDSTRVFKDDMRVEAYGTIDELNAIIGFAKNFITDENLVGHLIWIQNKLFNVGGEIATVDGESFPKKVTTDDIKQLESWIDEYIDKIGRERAFNFILPGSNKLTGALHIARTVCRRAERRMITLSRHAEVSDVVIKFINRLSDCLYTFSRLYDTDLIGFDV